MEERLYRALCLLSAVLSLFVLLPANQFQRLPRSLDAALVVFGVLCARLYWVARRGRLFPRTLFAAMMLALAGGWCLNGGSSGSVIYFFFAASLYPGIVFRGRARWLMWGVAIATGLALLSIDYGFPGIVVPFTTPRDRFIDLMTGYAFAAATCFVVVLVVVASFDEERRREKALNRELADVLEVNRRRAAQLQQTLAEIKTLEGLLPICARCKKIRDEAGQWQQIETYVSHHTGAMFSHGFCPDCVRAYDAEAGLPASGPAAG